jgi:hypothetical protein
MHSPAEIFRILIMLHVDYTAQEMKENSSWIMDCIYNVYTNLIMLLPTIAF